MIRCDDPRRAGSPGRGVRPSVAAKKSKAFGKSGNSRNLDEYPDSASHPHSPRDRGEVSIWAAVCLLAAAILRLGLIDEARRGKTICPSRHAASKGSDSTDVSQFLITGLPRDLASAEGRAAKGSQRTLNHAWLTIRPIPRLIWRIAAWGRDLAEAPGVNKETARSQTTSGERCDLCVPWLPLRRHGLWRLCSW